MRVVASILLACALLGAPAAPALAQGAWIAQATPPPQTDPDEGLRELPPDSRAAPDTTSPRSDTPALILLAVVAALALVALAIWGGTRFAGAEPAWVASLRHSFAEAGWRAAGAWDDFADWLRRS